MSFQLSAIGDGNEQATSEAAPGVLVILGASGDLTKRLLMPALYNLACDGLLPEDCAVVGMARDDMTTETFRSRQREEIARYSTRQTFDADRWGWLESRLHYMVGAFDDAAAYGRLRELVEEVGGGTAAAGNTLLYLAISPDFFTVVTTPTWFATRRPGSWRRCGCFVPVMLPATVSAASMVQASRRTAPHRLATARSPTSIRSRTRRRSPAGWSRVARVPEPRGAHAE